MCQWYFTVRKIGHINISTSEQQVLDSHSTDAHQDRDSVRMVVADQMMSSAKIRENIASMV